jgi:hypothetical protein
MGIIRLRRFTHCLLAFALFVALAACASGPKEVNHAFSFDTWIDSPNDQVLNYRYSSDYPEDWQLRDGIGQQRNVNGWMPRGDTLYVKWRIKATGAVYEDTVDLGARLPRDITGHRIHFVVKGPQLYVYLVSPKKRTPSDPQGPLRMYSDLVVYTLYPDPTPPNRFN